MRIILKNKGNNGEYAKKKVNQKAKLKHYEISAYLKQQNRRILKFEELRFKQPKIWLYKQIFVNDFDPHYINIISSIPSKSSTNMSTFCEKITQNQNLVVNAKQGMRFVLNNIALDLNSNEAALFLINEDKQILIAQLSRNVGGIRSMNICLEFGQNQKVGLFSKGGIIHLIGNYKSGFKASNSSTLNQSEQSNQQLTPEPRQRLSRSLRQKPKPDSISSKKIRKQQKRKSIQQKQVQQPQQQQQKQQIVPRRSSRSRAPQKPIKNSSQKSAKKQKQYLNNMAKYFDCQIDDEDQDEDDDQSFGNGEEVREDDDDDQDDDDESFKGEQKMEKEEDEEEEDQDQIFNSGKATRKMRSRSQRLSTNQRQDEKNDNPKVLHGSQDKRQSKQMEHLVFSVPKRNPYTL